MTLKHSLAKAAYSLSKRAAGIIYRRRRRTAMRWPAEVVVSGFLGETFGLGRAAELTAKRLGAAGFEVVRHDIRPLLNSKALFMHGVPGESADRAWVLQVNAPEAIAAFARINPGRCPRGPRLAYWAWELDIPPRGWGRAAPLFDAHAAPSEFAADSLSKLGFEFTVLPHPVLSNASQWGRAGACEADANHDRPYVFFTQMDGPSSLNRKNVLAVVAAFKRLPKTTKTTRLIVKTQRLADDQRQRLANAIGDHDRIDWIDEALSNEKMNALILGVDCVVSAHRAEGYGLAMAEAVALGKDVIATAWSGNLTFMGQAAESLIPYTLIAIDEADEVYGQYAQYGGRWADPSVDALSHAMAQKANAKAPAEALQRGLARAERIWDRMRPGGAFPVNGQ